MRQYLKNYQVKIRTIAPVFIGSGKEIGKKEYLFLNQRQVGILDTQLFYGYLKKLGKEQAFEQYLLGNNYMDLKTWLWKQNLKPAAVQPYLKYVLDCGDAILEKGANRLQVLEGIKDAYGKPYIPGSSLKGMFRTVLLGADIIQHPEKFKKEKEDLKRNAAFKKKRSVYLKKEIEAIEGATYRVLDREKNKSKVPTNDILQGFQVGDSNPISTEDLVLCQKIDLHVNEIERKLPILRECIKPGTEICFSIAVDTDFCKITEKTFCDAMELFMVYYKNFMVAFGEPRPEKQTFFCGGGVGFPSKTVLYPMYGKQEGIRLIQTVFEKTNVPKVHKHDNDDKYGVSPHTLKCTRYQGKRVQMGLCRIEQITSV